jgi:hypothetical protein
MKRTFAMILAALAAAALFGEFVYAVLVAAHVSEPGRHHGLGPAPTGVFSPVINFCAMV